MKPFVATYDETDKEALALRAIDYIIEWLLLNNLPLPNRIDFADVSLKMSKNRHWVPGLTGFYQGPNRRIWINLPACQQPGRGYSWPGYKGDRTAAGVLAHEVGHHVAGVLRPNLLTYSIAVQGEPPVTGYRPNIGEDFAEAMRLFIMNPSLLKHGRPKRYKALRALGLVPPHRYRYTWVMRRATPRFKKWARSWAGA